MRPVLGDVDAAFGGQARDPEGREEAMQQGRMVGVPHILEIELPVVVQDLRGRAEDLGFAMQYAVNARADQIADVARQRRRLGREGAEDELTEPIDAQLFEAV